MTPDTENSDTSATAAPASAAMPWEEDRAPAGAPAAPPASRNVGPWQEDYKDPTPPAPPPDTDHFEGVVKSNLENHLSVQAEKAKNSTGDGPKPWEVGTPQHEAKTFFDAVEAGFQMSVKGLTDRHALPTTVLPEHADWFMRTAAFAGQTVGDLPSMMIGGAIGGAVGLEGGPVGVALGAAGMGFGLPALLRQGLIDKYQKGSIKDFGDFWTRVSGSMIAGTKGAATGVGTELTGGMATGLPYVGGPLTGALAKVAAMTEIGKRLDGQVPKWTDFLDSATALVGFHAATMGVSGAYVGAEKVAGKLGDIYAKTGASPAETALAAKQNPEILQDIVSNNVDVPQAMKAAIDPKANDAAMNPQAPRETVDPTNKSGVLADNDYTRGNKLEIEKPAPKEEEKAPAEGSLENVKAGSDAVEELNQFDKQIVYSSDKKSQASFTFRKLFTQTVDALDPIKQAQNALNEGGDKLKVVNDPYWLSRLSRAADEKAHAAVVGEGPRDAQGNPTGTPSLSKILEPFNDDRRGFTNFLTAAVNLERAGKGVETGFQIDGPGGAREVFNQGKEKYSEAAKQVTKLANDVTDFGVAKGVIKPGAAEASKAKYEYYAPMRSAEKEGFFGSKGASSTPLKALEGKELGAKVLDPIEQLYKKIYGTYRIAAFNESVQALSRLVEKPGESVPDGAVAKEIPAEGPKEITDAEITDPDTVSSLVKKGEITYFDQGERKTLVMPEEVAKAMRGASPQETSIIVKAMHPMAQIQRAGAINTFDFFTKHAIRAESSAFSFSQNGYIYGYGFVRGMLEQILNTEQFKDARWSGALMGSAQSLDKSYIQSDFFKLNKQTGIIDTMKNVITSPAMAAKVVMDKMSGLAEMVANAPRAEEYRLAMKGKERNYENMMEAARAAREVLPDASRMGADLTVRAISKITPFMNVRLQGNVMLAEKLADPETRYSTLLKAGLSTTIPSLYLWWANKDDKDLQQTDNYTRDLTYQIPVDHWAPATDIQKRSWPDHLLRENPITGQMEANSKTIYKIPKSFEEGILFGSLAERALDYAYKHDPKSFDGFGRTLLESMKLDAIPAALAPVAEQWANKSFLTGSPIIPHHLEGLTPDAQVTAYTSETAKQIGSLIGHVPGLRDIGPENAKLSSPMVLDNYIREWTGGVGKYVTQALDKALVAGGMAPETPHAAGTLADTPYVKAFVWRYPTMGARSIQEFETRSADNKRAIDTYQYLFKNMDADPAVAHLLGAFDQGKMADLGGLRQTIGQFQGFIKTIDKLPESQMSPNDKRQLEDGFQYQSIRVAQEGNKAFDMFEAKAKELAPQMEALRKQIEEKKLFAESTPAQGAQQTPPWMQPPAQGAQQPQNSGPPSAQPHRPTKSTHVSGSAQGLPSPQEKALNDAENGN